MQAACYEYFLNGGGASLVIIKNDKEAPLIHDILAFLGRRPYVLPDFRASRGEDLRTYSSELFALLSSLNRYVNDPSSKKVLIAPLRTLLHPLPAPALLLEEKISFGDQISLKSFKEKL